jgi:hypothetical protein
MRPVCRLPHSTIEITTNQGHDKKKRTIFWTVLDISTSGVVLLLNKLAFRRRIRVFRTDYYEIGAFG